MENLNNSFGNVVKLDGLLKMPSKINIFSEENTEYSNNKKKTKSELFHFLQKHLEIIK